MTKNTYKIFKIVTVSLPFFLLLACQSNSPQKKSNSAVNKDILNAEAIAMDWAQLQQSTLMSLRDQSFGEAEIKIQQMMALAADDSMKWEYIRMAVISMPNDLALKLVDQA